MEQIRGEMDFCHVGSITKTVESINKKARKANLPEVQLTISEPYKTKKWDDAKVSYIWELKATYEVIWQVPVLVAPGYQIVGYMERKADAVLVYNLERSHESVWWKKATEWDGSCAHCGHNRARVYGYVVHHIEDDDYAYIGTSCVNDFVAHDIAGDICRAVNFIQIFRNLDDEFSGFGSSCHYYVEVEEVFKLVAGGFMSWKCSYKTDEDKYAFKNSIANALVPPTSLKEEDRKELARFKEYCERQDVQETKNQMLNRWKGLTPSNEFEHNALTLIKYGLVEFQERDYRVIVGAAVGSYFQAMKAREKAQEAAEPKEPVVEGRIPIRGQILSLKFVEGYGYYDSETLKGLIKDERGFRVWGTIPDSCIDVEIGDTIELTATVTKSNDDEFFGFYKRPSKVKLIKETSNV